MHSAKSGTGHRIFPAQASTVLHVGNHTETSQEMTLACIVGTCLHIDKFYYSFHNTLILVLQDTWVGKATYTRGDGNYKCKITAGSTVICRKAQWEREI